MTPAEARLRAQIAANDRWAREPDRTAATQAMRDGRWNRYLDRARDMAPDGATTQEINRRAESLRTADMRRMALKSARKRTRAS